MKEQETSILESNPDELKSNLISLGLTNFMSNLLIEIGVPGDTIPYILSSLNLILEEQDIAAHLTAQIEKAKAEGKTEFYKEYCSLQADLEKGEYENLRLFFNRLQDQAFESLETAIADLKEFLAGFSMTEDRPFSIETRLKQLPHVDNEDDLLQQIKRINDEALLFLEMSSLYHEAESLCKKHDQN